MPLHAARTPHYLFINQRRCGALLCPARSMPVSRWCSMRCAMHQGSTDPVSTVGRGMKRLNPANVLAAGAR